MTNEKLMEQFIHNVLIDRVPSDIIQQAIAIQMELKKRAQRETKAKAMIYRGVKALGDYNKIQAM